MKNYRFSIILILKLLVTRREVLPELEFLKPGYRFGNSTKYQWGGQIETYINISIQLNWALKKTNNNLLGLQLSKDSI